MGPEAQGLEVTQTEQPLWGYSVAPCTCTPNKIGQVMEANWTARAGHSASDWVGIFSPGANYAGYHNWSYVETTATSGKVRLQLPASLAPGQYELRYYLNDGFQLAAVSAPFTVTY